MSDEFERFSDSDRDPVAKHGLRAMREEGPSDASIRATLAALGVTGETQVDASTRSAPVTFLTWSLSAFLVGFVVLGILYWLRP